MQKNNYFLAFFLCFLFFQGFSQTTHKHYDEQQHVQEKLKSVQLIFDADSLVGFNEEAAWQQAMMGTSAHWEKTIQVANFKRNYINKKYKLVKEESVKRTFTPNAGCTNMGFETGNTSGWTFTEGRNANSILHTTTNNWGTVSNRFKVVGSGFDNIIPSLKRVPTGGGLYSLLLNDSSKVSSGEAVKAKQTFNVSASNSVFIYRYAVVLEAEQTGASAHTCTAQPYFNISFTDASGNPIPCTDFNVVAGSSNCTTGTDPDFRQYIKSNGTATDYYYKDWVTKSFDLSAYLGQNVTIEFISSDCNQTGHAGWAYIDCACQSMVLSLNGNELPFGQINNSLCSMGSNTLCAPAGFTSYSWSQSGGGGITGQTGQCINVTNAATYSVTLGMQGVSCNSPILYSTFSLVPAPSATFNYTATSCQNSLAVPFTSSVNLNGGPSISSYAWDFNNDGITDNSSANPTFTFSDYGTHITQFSASNGACSATATKTISIQPAPTVDILGNSNCSLSCIPLTGQLTGYTSPIKTPSFSTSPNYSISSSGTVAITSTINVSGLNSATLTSVCLNIDHTRVSDLSIYLICPSGNTLNLSLENGGTGDNYTNTYFDINAFQDITLAAAPFTGTFQPEGGPLNNLNSCSMNGNWTLKVVDKNSTIGGTLKNWSLRFNNIDSSPITSYSWSPAVPSYTYAYTQLSNTSTTPSFSAAPNGTLVASSTLTSTLNVSGLNTASLTSVCLNIDHNYVGSLYFYLVCPSGTTLALSEGGNGSSGDDYTNTCFNLTSSTNISSGSPPFNAASGYLPSGGSLNIFNSCNKNGVWKIYMVDNFGIKGVLQNWTLTFTDYQTETIIGTMNTISSSSWTPNSNGNAVLSPTVCPSSITAYTLTATSSNGCSATDVITVGPATTASISASTLTIGCGNASQTATVTSTPTSDVIYSWSPAPASGGNSTVATFTNAGTYKCSVTNTLTNCTATVQVIVSNTANTPTTTASVTGTLTCSTPTVILNSTLAGMTYTWSAPSTGTVTNANSQSAIANGIGTYTLAITNPTSNCTYTTTTSVSQNTVIPTTTVSVTGTLTCSTSTVSLNSSLSGVSYTWSAPSTGTITNPNSQNAVTNGIGIYTLTTKNTANGCTFTATTSVTQNTVQPTVNAGLTKTLTCVSPSVSLTGTVSPSNSTVKWTGANVCTVTTSITASVCAAGIYTLTATHPTNGCVANSTVEIVSDAAIPTVTLIPVTNSITCTNTLVAVSISSTTTPITYTWSGTGIVSGSSTATISVTKSGIFTYTVTDTNSGCKTTGSQTVPQNTISPIVSAGSNKTITCSSSSVSLTGTVSPIASTLNWTGGTICGTTTLQTTSACAAGIYSLTATDPINGCVSTSTVQVFADGAIPSVTLIPTNTITCTNTLVTVGLTSTVSPNTYTYTWSGSGIVSATNTNTISVNQDGVYNYTVTSGNGCAKTGTQVVTQNTVTPTTTVSVTGTLTCISPTVTLNSVTAGLNYTWTAPSLGGVSNANSKDAIGSIKGTYTLTIKNPVNGCIFSTTTSVTQNTATPTTTASVTGTLTCATLTVSLNSTLAEMNYTWTSPSGSLTNANSQNAIANTAGIFTLAVTNPTNGCAYTTTTSVSQNTLAPTTSVSATGTITCTNPTVTLSSTLSGKTYTWTTASGSNIANTQNAITNVSGTHILHITNPDNGCSSTATVTVIENKQKPDPTFNIDPAKGTAPLVVNFNPNANQTSNSFEWNFGDSNNNTSILSTPNHTYNDLGTFVVSLVVTNNASQCKDSTQLTVLVYENSSIVIPNVFTPNGDGANDSFKIHTVGINELTCEIYNRWGTKLYTISGPNDSWDGAENSAGTYFFILNAKGIDGKEYNEKGFLTMFK